MQCTCYVARRKSKRSAEKCAITSQVGCHWVKSVDQRRFSTRPAGKRDETRIGFQSADAGVLANGGGHTGSHYGVFALYFTVGRAAALVASHPLATGALGTFSRSPIPASC
jgi:hypothetical protein